MTFLDHRTTIGESIRVEDLHEDPYPIFAQLRREEPFAWVPAVNAWFVSRWDDYEQLYRSRDVVNAVAPANPSQDLLGVPNILTVEGAVHEELRGSLHQALLPKAVNGYVEELAQPFVDTMLTRLNGRRHADLVMDYFEPISVMSTATLLGMGELHPDLLRRLFREMSIGSANHEGDEAKARIAQNAVAEATAELDVIFARLERTPDNSLISEMLHQGLPNGSTRPREFITPTILVILLGGLQEPGHGAGNIMHALLSHPDQLRAVVDDPDRLLTRAINEGLRWQPPAGTSEKCAQKDFEFHGKQARKGDNIILLNGSVNRDESHFVDGERFDIFRRESKHHAFGMGHHVCMGHWFARRVIDLAMRALLAAYPNVAFDPERSSSLEGWVFRGPKDGLFVNLN